MSQSLTLQSYLSFCIKGFTQLGMRLRKRPQSYKICRFLFLQLWEVAFPKYGWKHRYEIAADSVILVQRVLFSTLGNI